MLRSFHLVAILAFVSLPCLSVAQDPPEKTVTLCDVNDAKNKCPGDDCICVPDTFEITFDGDTDSVFQYQTFTDGLAIDTTIVTQTETTAVQGWSYGVAHDTTALTVTTAAIAGTDAAALLDFGFDATSKDNIETCDVVPGCANRTAGGGWISAVVLSFTKPIELPLERNTIAKAGYTLLKDVGEAGTLITVSNKLAKQKSPPADVNVTVGGKSRRWTTAVNAWVKKEGEVTPADPFVRGDVGVSKTGEAHPADGVLNVTDPVRIIRKLFQGSDLEFDCQKSADVDDNGAVEVTDAVYLCNYLFVGGASGPAPPAPFPGVGDDPTSDGLTCEQYP